MFSLPVARKTVCAHFLLPVAAQAIFHFHRHHGIRKRRFHLGHLTVTNFAIDMGERDVTLVRKSCMGRQAVKRFPGNFLAPAGKFLNQLNLAMGTLPEVAQHAGLQGRNRCTRRVVCSNVAGSAINIQACMYFVIKSKGLLSSDLLLINPLEKKYEDDCPHGRARQNEYLLSHKP
ncbi:MAG: hypothetical protein A3G87_04525 [Omnitrophica bacterium RIFCSPLOWO2_12_FULL_50_11]|nr:MAG: hypothetical protein A3G87_04525 [Omnitrophica bacterium RIFCSPLOWO2_12_FULL_50_11]